LPYDTNGERQRETDRKRERGGGGGGLGSSGKRHAAPDDRVGGVDRFGGGEDGWVKMRGKGEGDAVCVGGQVLSFQEQKSLAARDAKLV
jgi:hypothetical protein